MVRYINKLIKPAPGYLTIDHRRWAFFNEITFRPGPAALRDTIRAALNSTMDVLRSGSRKYLPAFRVFFTEEKKCSFYRKQAQRLVGVLWTKL